MALEKRWLVNLKGKDYILWAGLLDAATNAGLRSIEVNLIQFPSPENGYLAISQATATFEDGRFFTELGDAGPSNCSAQIAIHAVRMSATRAKGRALRDALNIGEAMVEELGPDSESQNGHHAPDPKPAPMRAKHDPQDYKARIEAAKPEPCVVCGELVEPKVANAAVQRFAKVLCVEHGKEEVARLKEVAATASA